jgi:hypothetical protein
LPRSGTLSMPPTELYFSRSSQDVCRAVPAHHDPFRTSSPALSPQVHPQSVSSALDCQDVQWSLPSVLLLDAQPSQTTQLDSFPLSIPTHLEDCSRPTAVLESGHKGIGSEPGTSSNRTALRSLPSQFCTSADQSTSMRARHRQRDPVPQSSTVTGARSDLAAETFSDDPITTSRRGGLPLSCISNFNDVSSARKEAKTQAVKRILKSIPRPPPSHLVLDLLDQAFVQPDEASLDEDDPPCASGTAQKGHRPNDYRISSCPRNTPSPDCFLPGDSGERVQLMIMPHSLTSILVVSSFGHASLDGEDHDFEDFVFFIPPDCPTSTPVASMKQAPVGNDKSNRLGYSPPSVASLRRCTREEGGGGFNVTWMF